MKKKIKLTKYQKGCIMVAYAAMRYAEASRRKTEKEAEKQFVKDVEEILNNL